MLRNSVRRYVTNIDPIIPPVVTTTLPHINIYKFRKWKYFRPYGETLSYEFKKSSFTVSSYNILSQHYLWPTVYEHVPLQYLNLEYRMGLLNQVYRQLDCDIMCFQEMEYDLYKKIWDNKEKYGVFHNYESVFVRKPVPGYWKGPVDKMDGSGIFIKSSQFKILAQDSFRISDRSFLSPNDKVRERLLSRNTVAVIVLLEHRFTKKRLVLSNTHLYWNPKFDDVKFLQTLILTREIAKFMQLHGVEGPDGENIIMCGDFNSNCKSLVYKYLSKVEDENARDKIAQICLEYGVGSSGFPEANFHEMRSSYPDDSYTVYSRHYKDVIDYIWYAAGQQQRYVDDDTDNKKQCGLELVKILDGVSPSYLSKEIGFPNDKYPSDHIPIVSQFKFR